MTKKSILNVTSRKKRDVMLAYTNSTAAAQQGGTTYSVARSVVTGGIADGEVRAFLWCATARDNTINSGGTAGNIFNEAARTSSTPYMVGLKEAIEIQCNSGTPWQWRRICFTMKGSLGLTINTGFGLGVELSSGYARLMNQVTGTPGGGDQYALFLKLFKGQVNSDWVDPMTAPTDNQRVTIKYDRTVSLASGNEDGFIRKYTRYHPMKKTLVYDDDQVGGIELASNYSVLGKAGMGDYYVVDLFRARDGATTSDQLLVRPESTLYWHEK